MVLAICRIVRIGHVGLLLAGFDPFDGFFGQHHGAIDTALDFAEDRPHLDRRILGLVGQVFDFIGDHRKPISLLTGS